MRATFDKTTGAKITIPDCADEYLFDIWAIGLDHGGCHTVEEFKKLVDELVEMALHARECLWSGKLFGAYGTPDEAAELESKYNRARAGEDAAAAVAMEDNTF